MKSWPLVYKLVGAALHRDKQSLNHSRRKAALNCPLPAILFAGLALFISSCAPQSHDAINALIVVGPSTSTRQAVTKSKRRPPHRILPGKIKTEYIETLEV